MAASDYAPNNFKNRLHLAGRPQMSSRPSMQVFIVIRCPKTALEVPTGIAIELDQLHRLPKV
jgi:hypothetical protein